MEKCAMHSLRACPAAPTTCSVALLQCLGRQDYRSEQGCMAVSQTRAAPSSAAPLRFAQACSTRRPRTTHVSTGKPRCTCTLPVTAILSVGLKGVCQRARQRRLTGAL